MSLDSCGNCLKMFALWFLVLALIAGAKCENIICRDEQYVVYSDDDGSGWRVYNKYGEFGLRGNISVDANLTASACTSDATCCLRGDQRRIEMRRDASCLHISTTSHRLADEMVDCVDLGSAHWFGGPQQDQQYWPIEKLTFSNISYIPQGNRNMNVAERYWLNSNGIYVYVSSEVALFVDQHSRFLNSLCFIAKNSVPYLASRPTLTLKYSICGLGQGDAREAHLDAIQRFLKKPSGVPDERMIRYPIWSTWARYKAAISQEKVLQFAEEIVDNGFNNSQIEIDDKWETCYGSLTFDTSSSKFPDMRNLSLTLRSMGFRVTLWTHPFINTNCEPYFSEAVKSNYLVKNQYGFVKTTWWNGQGGLIDYTKPDAVKWRETYLNKLMEDDLIDSFKYDAGESSFAPQIPVLNSSLVEQPAVYTTLYVEQCAKVNSLMEVRVAFKTQHLPVFVRMMDKASSWGFDSGLKSLVTSLLQMNMNGYPFVLPDMIGGNGYFPFKPTKELFIRWLQANTFMPALQFSFVPWDFDQETVEISKKFTALHARYSDLIMELAQKAVEDGTPINPPIWWLDSQDPVALAIDSEFLLGSSLLVAPVMIEGATVRDVYLPRGLWADGNSGKEVVGPTWLRGYEAPLATLPYFILVYPTPSVEQLM